MHVCHVITRLIVGGAQENTLLTCEGLHQRGYGVTLISGPTAGREGSLVERARRGGYRFLEVEDLVRAVNPWRDVRARRVLAAEFRRLRPDVVHTHSSKAGILARLAAHDARVPILVHTIHGMSFNRTQPWLVRQAYAWLERRVGRHTTHVVAVAQSMIEQTCAAGVLPRERMSTVYSGMEVERFDPARYDRAGVRAAWGVGEAEVVVGTVARLFRGKGYEQLIPIMSRAAKRGPRLRFVWVGDGARRRAYEEELKRLGLAGVTTVLGLVQPTEIPRLLAGFDVLAHASQWEGLPRGVVQALLMRVPVVAFEIDGTPEVVTRETGRTVRLNDLDGFADAIVELASDGARRAALGAAGRALCQARFDWRTMVDELADLYQRLARGADRPPGGSARS